MRLLDDLPSSIQPTYTTNIEIFMDKVFYLMRHIVHILYMLGSMNIEDDKFFMTSIFISVFLKFREQ